MKTNRLPAIAIGIFLSVTPAVADEKTGQKQSLVSPDTISAQLDERQVKPDLVIGTKAHANGYANPNVFGLFVVGYLLFAAVQ